MPNFTVKCAVCSTVFHANTRNEKYCSPLCRAKGTRQVREEWEQNNNYKVMQRQRMREKRMQEQTAMKQHRQLQRKKAIEASQKEMEQTKEQRLEEIRKKAAQGDLNAMQELAIVEGDNLEYWRLYKERILKSEKEFGREGRHLVGGIEIHEVDFEHLVVKQLEERT